MKRVVQVYKPPGRWRHQQPPGIGDFIRGLCVLYEVTQKFGIELRVDVSLTEFADLLQFDPTFFHAGDPARIVAAREYDASEGIELVSDIWSLAQSETDDELYVFTNAGAWSRADMPDDMQQFVRKFYAFNDALRSENDEWLGAADYSVLSIRCGDKYFGKSEPGRLPRRRLAALETVIKRDVLPTVQHRPLVVMSDSAWVKEYVGRKFGMKAVPGIPQHARDGSVYPVARDLDLLSRSKFNYHINVWANWWSGFSHFTSLAFGIPELNIVGPLGAPPIAKLRATIAGRFPALRKLVQRWRESQT